MKFKIFKYEKVTSTNNIAMNLIKEKEISFGYVSAKIQTKGRGTRGREWISERGNLFGSIFFPLKKNYPEFNEFSVINPIIISDVLKNFCEFKSINLKYPNDIFVNKKKICGILQEKITFNNINFLIIGIGINLVSNPNINNVYKATNILLETKKKPEINKVINLLLSSYEKFFIDLDSYNYHNYKKKADSMALSGE